MWDCEKVKTFITNYVSIDGKPALILDWQWSRLIKPLYQCPRTVKRVLMYLPKKSGKSQIVSVLLLVGLLERAGSNVICLASTVQQAKIVFDGACRIIESNKALSARFWCRKHLKVIQDRKTGSVCQIFSGSPRGKAGPNVDLLLCDEISDFTASDARLIYDQLAFSTMARSNSIQMYFSTCGFEREGHIWFDLYQEALTLQKEPAKDPQTLGIVYSVPEDLDWRLSENWWSSLPSCPAIVPKEFYLNEYKRLQTDTLGEVRFRTLLLNQPLGMSADSWISQFSWMNCKETFEEKELWGCKAWGGLDMSRRFDLTAWVLLIEKDNRLYLLPRFFCCEAKLKDEKHDGFPYALHARNPAVNLFVNAGDVIDPSYIRKQILADAERFRFQSVGYDPAYLSDETRQILEFQHGLKLTEVKQTYKVMSPAVLQFERWVRTKRIAHNNNPIMNWCVESARLKTDGGLALIDSKRSRSRIDGVQAATVAIQRYLDKSGTMLNPLIVL